MGFVTAQLVQPYKDRPNEGSLAIFTEFSPMADPSFETGRPGESAVELGRIIDRGLRYLLTSICLDHIIHCSVCNLLDLICCHYYLGKDLMSKYCMDVAL